MGATKEASCVAFLMNYLYWKEFLRKLKFKLRNEVYHVITCAHARIWGIGI